MMIGYTHYYAIIVIRQKEKVPTTFTETYQSGGGGFCQGHNRR